MTKFRVPLKIVFTAACCVEAKDEEEAETIACKNIRAGIGEVVISRCPELVDIVYDNGGFAEVRDDESVEEVEE